MCIKIITELFVGYSSEESSLVHEAPLVRKLTNITRSPDRPLPISET